MPDSTNNPGDNTGDDTWDETWQPARPPARRRLNPNDPPFNQFPIIRWDRENQQIRVIRGDLHPNDVTEYARARVADDFEQRDFLVFPNRIGQQEVWPLGHPIRVGLDLTRAGHLPAGCLVPRGDRTDLTTYAEHVRQTGQRLLQIADQLTDMARGKPLGPYLSSFQGGTAKDCPGLVSRSGHRRLGTHQLRPGAASASVTRSAQQPSPPPAPKPGAGHHLAGPYNRMHVRSTVAIEQPSDYRR